jgi:hypothetical protein
MDEKNKKLRKNGGPGRGVGNFLRSIKSKVFPSLLDAVGVGDLGRAIGIISNSPDNAGLTKEESDRFFELIELDMQDLADARSMQKEALKQDDLFSKRFVYYLTMAVVGFVFLMVLALFFVNIPDENKTIIDMVVGIVIGGYTSIMAFYFGSSKGSKDKSSVIDKMTDRF